METNEGPAQAAPVRAPARNVVSLGSNPPLAVDVFQAAAMIGVCDDTIRREIDRGNLKACRVGRLLRIRVAELHAYLKRAEAV